MEIRHNNKIKLLIIALLLCSVSLFGNSIYIHAKAKVAQFLIQDAWNKTISQNKKENKIKHTVKPWSWADTFPVARLVVPSHYINQFILQGANGAPLAFGPGLYDGTKLPGSNNQPLPDTVIAGHHNTHFDFLKQLNLTDQFYIETFTGKKIYYQVNHINTYDITKTQLPINYYGKTIKLVTCLPDYVGKINPNKRLVITAVLINQLRLKLTANNYPL